MRTRDDVIKHFTYQPPREETAAASRAVDLAVTTAEREALGALREVGSTQLIDAAGTFRQAAHETIDEALRTCALAIFDTLPEVPDRTAALRTLWLARGLLHKAIVEYNDSFLDAALVRLAEVRIQAIGAIVLR